MRKPSCCMHRIIRTGTSTCRARSGTCRSCPRRRSTICSAAPRRACSSCRRATTSNARTSRNSATSWPDAVPRRDDESAFMSINRCGGAISLATAALLAAVAAGSVRAQDAVEAFYKGRQINLIVGYGPGGGYDLTARLLARHLGRFIPGNPSIVVQNMVGAGSLRAANFLYGAAPKDGTTFGVFGSDIPMIGLIGTNSAVQFDPRRFTWLGSSSSFGNDAYVLIVLADAKSPSLAAARSPGGAPIVLGGTGEGARDADVPK